MARLKYTYNHVAIISARANAVNRDIALGAISQTEIKRQLTAIRDIANHLLQCENLEDK